MQDQSNFWSVVWSVVQGAATLATIAAPFVALATYWHSHWHRKLKAQIASPAYRARLIDRLSCRSDGYYLALEHLLAWTERVFGPNWSLKALTRTLGLAYGYILLAALIAWVIANQTAPGGLEMFRDVPELAGRMWRAAAVFLAFPAGGYIISQAKQMPRRQSESSVRTTHRGVPAKRGRSWVPATVETLGVLVGIGALVMFGLTASIPAAILVFTLGFIAYNAEFLGAGGRSHMIAAWLPVMALLLAGLLALTGQGENAAVISLFLVILPLTNALADWLSLGITRWLLTDLVTRRPGSWGLALHLLADLLAGLLSLGLLLATLVGTLELWAQVAPASLPFDWRGYWQAARAAPAQGIALWLMVLTTLLPTLAHVFWAIIVLGAQTSKYTRRAVELMRALPDTPEEAARNEVAGLIICGALSGLLRVVLLAFAGGGPALGALRGPASGLTCPARRVRTLSGL